jgi:hypothetical protein
MQDNERNKLAKLQLAKERAGQVYSLALKGCQRTSRKLVNAKIDLKFAERLLGRLDSDVRKENFRLKSEALKEAESAVDLAFLQAENARLVLTEAAQKYNELLSQFNEDEEEAFRRIKLFSSRRKEVQKTVVKEANRLELAERELTYNDCNFQIKFVWDSQRREAVANVTFHIRYKTGHHNFVVSEKLELIA